METNVRTKPPLFEEYTVEQLTELSPYSEAYLRDLEKRPERIRPHFRRVMAGVLHRPERDLFDTAPPSSSSDGDVSIDQGQQVAG